MADKRPSMGFQTSAKRLEDSSEALLRQLAAQEANWSVLQELSKDTMEKIKGIEGSAGVV